MKVLHDNVLVTEDKQGETELSSGIILSADITSGNKPARVIAVGTDCGELKAGDKVYLKWGEAMPVELEGVKCGVIAYEHIKLIVD